MGRPDPSLPLGAFVKLMRAAAAVSARVHEPLAAEGLTPSQFGVLEALYHKGPLCRRDLAAKILKTGGNITQVVDHLERRGWVVRRRDHEDRRIVTVHLTDEGRSVIERVYPKMEASIVQHMSVLAPEELEALSRLAKKLGLAASAAQTATESKP
ncbi:MarR family winged helix-turn-helix transcriptional regulator [Deferrisoma palaeochoriense]